MDRPLGGRAGAPAIRLPVSPLRDPIADGEGPDDASRDVADHRLNLGPVAEPDAGDDLIALPPHVLDGADHAIEGTGLMRIEYAHAARAAKVEAVRREDFVIDALRVPALHRGVAGNGGLDGARARIPRRRPRHRLAGFQIGREVAGESAFVRGREAERSTEGTLLLRRNIDPVATRADLGQGPEFVVQLKPLHFALLRN